MTREDSVADPLPEESRFTRTGVLKATVAAAVAGDLLGTLSERASAAPRTAAWQRIAEQRRPIVVALNTDVDTIELTTFRTIAAFSVTSAIYDPLMAEVFRTQKGLVTGTGRFRGAIAESMRVRRGGREVTFSLRKNARFANGARVTAEDVVWTLRRTLLDGGYVKVQMPFVAIDSSDQIVASGPDTVVLRPDRASPLFNEFMAFQVFGILDRSVAREHVTASDPWAVKWLSSHATPSGAYTLRKFNPPSDVVLAPNPNYYARNQVRNSGVTIQSVPDANQRGLLLRNGQVDLVRGVPPQLLQSLARESKLRVWRRPNTQINYLGMNNQRAPFDNLKVRQAISYAVPYRTILSQVFRGYASPAGGLVTRTMETYAGGKIGTYSLDIARARRLLNESGVGPFETDLYVEQSRAEGQQVAVFIQQSLRQIGITVNVRPLPDGEFNTRLNAHQLPMFMAEWYIWGEDPFSLMTFLVKSDSFTNFTGFKNAEIDRLIAQGTFETNPRKRAAISERAQRILLREAPMVYLYCPDWVIVTQRNVTGVTKDQTQIPRFQFLEKV
jgi:peptide/nickel transport system substrate-binding protein